MTKEPLNLGALYKKRRKHTLPSPFEPLVLRERERGDEDMVRTKGKEPLEGLGGPVTRARTKKAKEALQEVLTMLFEFRPKLQVKKLRIVNCTMFQEE
ncbi:hypothetical protein HKD37_14G040830 [Glycine soja]